MSSWTPCQIFRRFREKSVKFMSQVRPGLDVLKLIQLYFLFYFICQNSSTYLISLVQFFQLYPSLMMTRLDFHNIPV